MLLQNPGDGLAQPRVRLPLRAHDCVEKARLTCRLLTLKLARTKLLDRSVTRDGVRILTLLLGKARVDDELHVVSSVFASEVLRFCPPQATPVEYLLHDYLLFLLGVNDAWQR